MKKLLVAIMMFMVCGVSHAQLIFSPAFNYETDSTKASIPALAPNVQTDTKSSLLMADMRLGYILPAGIYLGGMYTFISGTSTTGAVEADIDGFLAGPSVGYYDPRGFYSLVSVHLMGDLGTSAAGAELKYTGATGFQVDLGWNFPITSSFGIGPQVTYRNIDYAKVESTGNATQDTDYKATNVDWALALWFMF